MSHIESLTPCQGNCFLTSNIVVGGFNLIAISLLAIGIITVFGLYYPESPVASFGSFFGSHGSVALLISSAIIFGATSLKTCFFNQKPSVEESAALKSQNQEIKTSPTPKDPPSFTTKSHTITPISTSKKEETKYYAIRGSRFGRDLFKDFISQLQKELDIVFTDTFLEDTSVTITEPGHAIMFDYWGRPGGVFKNPLPEDSSTSITYVAVGNRLEEMDGTSESGQEVVKINYTIGVRKRIYGIEVLKKALGIKVRP